MLDILFSLMKGFSVFWVQFKRGLHTRWLSPRCPYSSNWSPRCSQVRHAILLSSLAEYFKIQAHSPNAGSLSDAAIELHLEHEGQHCGYLSLRQNWNVQHSREELSLKHLQLEPLGLLELVVVGHRDVHNRGSAPQNAVEPVVGKNEDLHPPRRLPPQPPPQEPTLGLPGAALDRSNKDRRIAWYRALGSAGAGRTPEGGDTERLNPPGNNSRRSVAHHGTNTLHLQNPWQAPSFTSQVPHKGQDLTGY